jgi:hypothetical protein
MAFGPPRRVLEAQIAGQFLTQGAAGLHEQRQIDRLVRHAHLRIVWERFHQPTRDLGGRPTQLEFRFYNSPQTLAYIRGRDQGALIDMNALLARATA